MQLFKLISGQLEVNKIIKRKENNLYLIFPSNSEIAYYGILYAEKYAKEIKAERIIIVTENDTISDNSDRMISLPKRIYKVSTKKMEGFLMAMSMHSDLMGTSIYNNVFYVSDDYPYGGTLKTMMLGEFFEKEYIIWNRIYHRDSFYYAEE